MANNYLQFSEVLQIQDDREEAWLRHQLTDVLLTNSNTIFEEAEGDQIPADESYELVPRFLAEAIVADEDVDASLSFEWEFQTSDGGGRILWIHADLQGTPAHAAFLVQDFLKQFDPASWWTLTWALICDQPRCGEFSGGALLVTAAEIQSVEAESWVYERAMSLALTAEKRR